MKLFIAEKPSLARAIAAGIGVGKKSDGYISLNGDKEIVTWCYGHMLEQLNPDEYAEKYRAWRLEDLPIIPSLWKLKVKLEAVKQFKIVR
jgi:DNA topoisomerase-3